MKRKNKSDGYFKAGLWYTICNYISKCMVFIATPIFTRMLSTSEIGLFSNFTSWIGIFAVIFTLDLYSSINIAYVDYKENINGYISSILVAGSLITLLCCAIVLLNKSYILSLTSFSEIELIILMGYLLVYPAYQMYLKFAQMRNDYKNSAYVTLISSLSSLIISVLLVFFMKDKYLGRIIGHIAPSFVICLVLYIYFISQKNKISIKYVKYAIVISLPLIFHSLASNILNSSSKVIINKLIGSEQAGLFGVAFSCTVAISILSTSLNCAILPWLFKKLEMKEFSDIKKKLVPCLILFGIISYVFLLIVPEVVLFMGGETYVPAIMTIPPLTVGFIFQFASCIYVNVEIYEKKQIYIAAITIISALACVGINYLLIPKYGIIAASFATLASYIILFILHCIVVNVFKKSMCCPQGFIFIYLIISLLGLLPIYLLYKNSFARYIAIFFFGLAFIALCISKKKDIKEAVKIKSIDPLIKNTIRIKK